MKVSLSFDEPIDAVLAQEDFLERDDEIPETPLHEQLPLDTESDAVQAKQELTELGGTFRIVGQFSKLYILLDFGDDLVLVDQHAAHERILYERLRNQVNHGTVIVQEHLDQ